MFSRCILFLLLIAASALATQHVASAQQPTAASNNDNNPLAVIQDSFWLESFPVLNELIDLLSRLIDLVNQAEQLLSDTNIPTELPDIPGVTTPDISLPTEIPPGGWGFGPVPSVQ
jgi:hypothetical protein